ncbi:amidohydrolase [Aliidiomarina minuta]|uniref:Amidohydrolase n=1 Tax=Aliidiomarina minuta TaxID=880057 RepID=A0A432W820_9GAMM|nr:amidohydrolase family protein [Aliidiomarina minuta]RUO26106.1 amidohydrolase [Aliidiomarina minuta]
MKVRWRLASTALAALGTLSVTAAADQTTPVRGLHDNSPSLVALQNATIVTEPGQQLTNATLVMENGKITAVNRNNRAPEGARVIDATGYTLYPGFIDPYSNYGVPGPKERERWDRSQRPEYNNKREGGNASNDAIHAQVRWVEHLANQQDKAKDYVEQGFTSVQTARMDGIFQGQASTVSLADRIPNNLVYRETSRQFASFDKGSSMQQYPNSLMGSIALIRQTLSDAAWYKDASGLQTLHGEAIEYNAALQALTHLDQQGVIFQAQDELDITRIAQVFGEFEIPVTYVGSGFEYARAGDIAAAGGDLILPLNFPAAPEVSEQHAELDVSIADLRHWERAPGNPAALAQAGIDFAFTLNGMESNDDFWSNIRKAIDHGLEPERALAALTTTAARIAGVEDKAGKIATGYQADIVVSRGDIFSDGEIVSVWLQGQETSLKPMHPTEFQGTYALQLDNQSYELKIDRAGQLRGTLSRDDEEVELRHLSSDEHSISFIANMTAFGQPGIFRFKLSQSARQQFSGTAADPMGREVAVTAQREEAEEQVSESRQAGSVAYTGELTFPNIGMGVKAPPEQQNLHIQNATVWTADDQGVLENADIIVRNGVIHRIGEGLSTPRGYQVIDAEGMHVTPGIVDEHSHIAISRGVNEGTEAITSETHIGDVVNPDDVHIYRSLAGGATVAHLLHGSANPVGGRGQAIKLRWGENAEALKFAETPPTIKMALGENVKQSNWGIDNNRYPQTRMGVTALIHDFFRSAKEYEQARRDYDNLSRAERRRTAAPRRDYRLEALLEIMNGERHVHAHSYIASEVLALMEVADDLDFNIHTFTHILEGYKVADEMAAHGANASSFADWWAFKIEAFDAIPHNMCVMMDKGILTSINSDSNDLQRRMNIEAAKSVRYCGMSEEDALKMITLYPAQQLEIDEYVGSITTGKHADLVFWNAHPLSAYAQVQQTWIEGSKYFDREQDLERRQLVQTEHQALIQKVLSEGDDAQRGASNGYKSEQPSWHCDSNHDVWLDVFSASHHQHGGHH